MSKTSYILKFWKWKYLQRRGVFFPNSTIFANKWYNNCKQTIFICALVFLRKILFFRQIYFLDKYLQTNGVYMRASGITLVFGPLVTVTPQYTPIAPTTAKDGRGSFIQNTKGRTNTKGRLNCIYTFYSQRQYSLVLNTVHRKGVPKILTIL